MGEVTSRAQLIDAPMFGARSITATLPRTEIEEALRMEETPELILDIDRRGDGDVEAHTLRVAWSDDQLKELLRDTSSDDITLFFDGGEVAEALADEDIEAHGMRERTAAVLTVAAVAVGTAGAVAHPASAKTAVGGGGGSGAGATIEMVSDAASSGVAAAPEMVSDAASTGVRAAPELISDSASSGPSGVQVAEVSGPQLVSDAASGPGVEVAQASGPQLVSDAASGPGVEAAQASGPELVSDAASTGTPSPAQSTASAGAVQIAGTDSGMSASQIAETAAGGALVLMITAAGFAVRGKRRHEQPA
jgi:hypothetical protein